MSYVMVAVPAELLPKIAEMVAAYTGETLMSEPSPMTLGSTDTSFSSETKLIDNWTPQLLRRAYTESGDAMRRILDYLAENAGEEVTSADIADNVEAMKDWNSVAGALGAFRRRCGSRYGIKNQPWSWRFDGDQRVLMKMPAAVAEVIKQAAAE